MPFILRQSRTFWLNSFVVVIVIVVVVVVAVVVVVVVQVNSSVIDE